MKALIIFSVLLLAGCAGDLTGYAGVDMGVGNFDGYKMENPIGRFGIRYRPDDSNVELHCEHLSSIPDIYDNQGINKCGAAMLFNFL